MPQNNGPISQGIDPGLIDTASPSAARMYDYFLGGRDNYEVDRRAAEEALTVFPQLRDAARANRAFLGRAVRYLAGEAGVDQFLDIGAGMPSPGNTRQAAHSVNPRARIVGVDNDPMVLTHGRALFEVRGEGRTVMIPGDVRRPGGFLGCELLNQVIDLGRPVAVLMVALLHFVSDHEEPFAAVRTVMGAVPSGSYLVLSHASPDHEAEAIEAARGVYQNASARGPVREPYVIERFFEGLEMVPPGLVPQPWWRPDEEPVTADARRNWLHGGIGRKP
jgi:hypothetical protein